MLCEADKLEIDILTNTITEFNKYEWPKLGDFKGDLLNTDHEHV